MTALAEIQARGATMPFPPPFQPWPKIARLNREVVVTEKLDGTNAQVYVCPETRRVAAASRTRWITPEDDNYGFAKWVKAHEDELRDLGPGFHAGEWWGQGVQRGYGLAEKRFSLFNVHRWTETGAILPACCSVVPVVWRGPFDALFQTLAGCYDRIAGQSVYVSEGATLFDAILEHMRVHGSFAVPGFRRPEGVVVYHTAARTMFKVTLERDAEPKRAQP